MKLLLITVKSDVSRGGIATWTERFLERCEYKDIDCKIINTEAVGERAVQGEAKRNLCDEIIRTRRIFTDLKNSLVLGMYDAVHLNTCIGVFGLFRDYIMAKRIKRKKLRLITHFHCNIPDWIHNRVSYKFLEKLVYLSDTCLVLNETSRLYLKNNFSVESQKVPNFINEELIRDTDKAISNELTTAFFVGRVSEAKGARELWELAKRFPYITFRLMGDISDEVATWNKPANILLEGGRKHSEVIAAMDESDIFVFPSHSEGFSLALMEAMARGLPAVATDVGANADMLADGCGLMTSIGDVDAMQEAIEKMMDVNIRIQMSKNAVQKVLKQYAIDRILEQFKAYYRGENEVS